MSRVQPVSPLPPASSTLPVEVPAICTRPLPPASSVRLLVPPALIAPAPANPSEVALTDIVSIEATPVSAPPVVTLRPPFEESANVHVALPISTLPVPVPKLTSPLPFTVKLPDP